MGRSKFAMWVVVASSAMAAPAWGQYGAYNHGYGPGMMWGGGWAGSLFGWFMMAIVFAIIVVFVVSSVRWLTGLGRHPVSPPAKSTPLDILKERFARGEIDKDEFEERKRHLMS